MADLQKQKAVEAAILNIEKQFGKGAIMRMDGDIAHNIPVISTGNISIDIALGCGGFPKGRIVEIYGPESSGKTSLALHLIAESQANGGIVAFIDAEHALDTSYAQKLGVSIKDMILSQPDCGEQALEIAETLARSGGVDVIVIDSVAALTPRAEINGEMGDSHMGLQARLMSQALRKLTPTIYSTQTLIIFINQLRSKIGVMFGSPETTTGGNALKFYASIRIDIRKITSIKEGDEITGNRTRIKVVKNKMAPPFKTTEVDISFGGGFCKYGSLLDQAVEDEVIKKSGSWYSYQDERIGQGRENVKNFLKENLKIYEEILQKILINHNLPSKNIPQKTSGKTEKIEKSEKVEKSSNKSTKK